MTKILPDDILESLYKLRIRESDQFKTALELYDMEIHQKISMLDYQKLKTIVRRSTDQKLRVRNFDAKNGRIETGAVVTSRRILSGVERGRNICFQWKEKASVLEGRQCCFRHESDDRAKPTPQAEPPSEPQSSKTRGGSVSRKRNARGRSLSGKFNRPACKLLLKSTCTKSACEYCHPPECQFYKN